MYRPNMKSLVNKIVAIYHNKQELISLLQNTSYKQLALRWNCHVTTVYSIRKELGIKDKRICIPEFLKQYPKEKLEDLYFNLYDRHLLKMAEGLDIYHDTLTKIFRLLNIKQQPHHVTEYPKFRKMISKRQKELAKIHNPIQRILKDPEFHIKAVQARQDKGSYTSPEYRAKLSKKHVEVLERGNHKFKNTDIELLLQAEFTKHNISFILDKGLINLTVPDMFIEPNIAVYADGDYWHSLPKAKVKDPYINEGLHRAGYKVFRFLGSEIKADVSKCVQQVVEYISSK